MWKLGKHNNIYREKVTHKHRLTHPPKESCLSRRCISSLSLFLRGLCRTRQSPTSGLSPGTETSLARGSFLSSFLGRLGFLEIPRLGALHRELGDPDRERDGGVVGALLLSTCLSCWRGGSPSGEGGCSGGWGGWGWPGSQV